MALRANRRNLIILIIVASALLAGAIYVKVLKPKTQSKTSPGNQSPGLTQDQSSKSSQTTQNSSAPNQPAQTSTGTTTTSIGKPTGALLSNHHVSLSGSHDSATEDSTCQTVAGATCDIRLTGPSGQVKTLGAKAVDGLGGAEFVWNVIDKGLTSGQWKVEAVASKGGDTEVSAADYLQVSP